MLKLFTSKLKLLEIFICYEYAFECLSSYFIYIEDFCDLSDLCQRGYFSSAGFIRNNSTYFGKQK
jgi:hypothetical protein